jgi:hypothetical protein
MVLVLVLEGGCMPMLDQGEGVFVGNAALMVVVVADADADVVVAIDGADADEDGVAAAVVVVGLLFDEEGGAVEEGFTALLGLGPSIGRLSVCPSVTRRGPRDERGMKPAN